MVRILTLISASLLASTTFGASSKLVPVKGESRAFERVYSTDYLKNHPLQLVTKTTFTLRSKGAALEGEWKATFRDIVSNEEFEAKAKAEKCEKKSKARVECYFGDRESGTLIVSSREGSVLLSLPVGQGVAFYQDGESKNERSIYTEMLIGTDEDNNLYLLHPKKAKRSR